MNVDKSPFGIGEFASHIMADGKLKRKTIYFASNTLSKAEQNYAQTEREGLAIFLVRANSINTFTTGMLRSLVNIYPCLGF